MTVHTVMHRNRPAAANSLIGGSNFHRRAKELRAWREAFKYEALAVRLPHLDVVDLRVTLHRSSAKSMPDWTAPYFAIKGATDGLVDAKVLTDDSPAFIRDVIIVRPVVSGFDALQIDLIPVELERAA